MKKILYLILLLSSLLLSSCLAFFAVLDDNENEYITWNVDYILDEDKIVQNFPNTHGIDMVPYYTQDLAYENKEKKLIDARNGIYEISEAGSSYHIVFPLGTEFISINHKRTKIIVKSNEGYGYVNVDGTDFKNLNINVKGNIKRGYVRFSNNDDKILFCMHYRTIIYDIESEELTTITPKLDDDAKYIDFLNPLLVDNKLYLQTKYFSSDSYKGGILEYDLETNKQQFIYNKEVFALNYIQKYNSLVFASKGKIIQYFLDTNDIKTTANFEKINVGTIRLSYDNEYLFFCNNNKLTRMNVSDMEISTYDVEIGSFTISKDNKIINCFKQIKDK